MWAMISHIVALSGLLGNGIGFVLGPLLVWLLKREDHPFINEQGREAVNFQLSMLLYIVIGVLLILVVIGIPILIVLGILAVVFPIIAAVKANNGEHYRYPLTIRFLK